MSAPSLRQVRAANHANVVVLPTAAPRQVSNLHYSEQRKASRVARTASPFTGRYRHPHAREADRLAEELAGIRQTPELLILSAIIRTMEPEAVKLVLEQLAPGKVHKSEPHVQALATIQASRLNVGQQIALFQAMDRRETGEGC